MPSLIETAMATMFGFKGYVGGRGIEKRRLVNDNCFWHCKNSVSEPLSDSRTWETVVQIKPFLKG